MIAKAPEGLQGERRDQHDNDRRRGVGKLQLYTACAGVPPQYLLPMYLDAGTNNEQYLHDPLYLGIRQKRPSTEELFSFVDEFVEAVQEVFPKCCIHFEDWTAVDAVHLLERYRDKHCVYNDDVQGTAGIMLAGMINATKLKGNKIEGRKVPLPRRRLCRYWPR